MKYLQLGGQMWTQSFANPLLAQKQQTKTIKTSGSEDGLLSESLLKDLRGHGIPVDYDAFMDQVSKLDQRMAAGLPVSSKAIRDLEAQANRVIQQNDYLKEAEKLADKNDARGEIAVGGRGQLYTLQENGKIKTVSIADYDAEKDGPAMTVNELIEHRKFNPTQQFDTTLTQVIGNSIGMQKINDYIMNIIQKVGSAQTTEEAYIDLASYIGREAAKKPSQQELQNLQNLYTAMSELGPDALFKSKEVRESKNLREAFDYIQSILPRDMQTQLRGRYVASGGNLNDSGAYIQSIIASSLGAANKTRNESYIDYEASLNKAAGKGQDSDHQISMTGLEQLVMGTLGKRQLNIVGKSNSGIQFTLDGAGMGKLTDAKNDIVNASVLSSALDRGLGALIDQNNIFFGDQKISPDILNKFVYDGQDVINVWAPVGPNGGVDFGKLAQYEELRKTIKNNPNLTQGDIQQLMAEIGINGTIDPNGNFVGNDPNMAQFIVLTGLTSDEVIDDDENEFSYKLQGDDKKQALERIKTIYAMHNKGKKGDQREKFPTGWFDWSTGIIAAPIFMRVGDTARFDAGTIVGHGARVAQQPYSSLIAKDQAQPIVKPSSSIL